MTRDMIFRWSERETLSERALAVGSAILFFIVANFALSVILFSVNIPIGPWHCVMSSALTIGYLFGVSLRLQRGQTAPFLNILAPYVVLLLVSLVAAGMFYDLSWDGQEYHQKAIIDLNNGWNPIHSHLPEAGSLFNIIITSAIK